MNYDYDKILSALPNSGYSMGENYLLYVDGQLVAERRNYRRYRGAFKHWKPTYGRLHLELKGSDLPHIRIIGGVVTRLGGYVKGQTQVRHCHWVEREGEKSKAKLVWKKGYIDTRYKFHAGDIASILTSRGQREESAAKAKAQALELAAAREMALLCEYDRASSIRAGNCESGTDNFIQRWRLKGPIRGDRLLKLAKKNNVLSFAERIITRLTHDIALIIKD